MGEKETASEGALKAQQPRKDQEQRTVSDEEAADDSGLAGARATTVKSSKSNTSDRQAANPEPGESTTVKGSKSNSSERLSEDPSASQATVKSSKSNSSE